MTGDPRATDKEICEYARDYGYVVLKRLGFFTDSGHTGDTGPRPIASRGTAGTGGALPRLLQALLNCDSELLQGARRPAKRLAED